MSDNNPPKRAETIAQFFRTNQLGIMLTVSIIISIVCAGIGLFLYNTSGTAQLDLSRPGYEGVGEIVDRDSDAIDYVEYPSSGPINESTLTEFEGLYQSQLENVRAVDAFGGDPLSPASLGIEEEPSS